MIPAPMWSRRRPAPMDSLAVAREAAGGGA
jgi:hypothetical protein